MKMAPILGYWNFRSIEEPIRLLLEYTGAEYEDVLYDIGEAPDYDRSSWLKVKYTLGLDFPNLPYYIDGDLKLTQSAVILKYLARKHGLSGGKTEQEIIQVETLEGEAKDMIIRLGGLLMNPDYEKEKDMYCQQFGEKIKQLSNFLGTKKFFCGDDLNYADFMLYEVFDYHQIWDSTILDQHQNIKDFLARIQALPAIAAYMKSDRYIRRPTYPALKLKLNSKQQ